MRRFSLVTLAAAIAVAAFIAPPAFAQQEVSEIPYVSVPDFLKYPPTMNLGETLAVAENSKGHIILLNHPGTATTGPLYGNATTNLLEFDDQGNFVREIGQGVYGLGYGHSVRFDNEDNLWVVDKGTNAVVKFDPAGYAVMNLGRRPEGFDHYEHVDPREARHVDGYFAGPTDVGWDAEGNIFISDGYMNSRVAKISKHGDWLMSWGAYGTENDQLRLPHNLQVDREGFVYVADRSNRRIQKFDSNGNYVQTILLDVPFDKTIQPVLGNVNPNLPDNTAPWSLCISSGQTQYLFASDEHPGRIYKMTLEGEMLGYLGGSGRQLGQFNWIHG
ncbi:MAG: 6-bladed beta-propeller, partial [Acidobacteriota bacterium]|nr:6-bladed beta-propeller [Acidobacteriota bacterium]